MKLLLRFRNISSDSFKDSGIFPKVLEDNYWKNSWKSPWKNFKRNLLRIVRRNPLEILLVIPMKNFELIIIHPQKKFMWNSFSHFILFEENYKLLVWEFSLNFVYLDMHLNFLWGLYDISKIFWKWFPKGRNSERPLI